MSDGQANSRPQPPPPPPPPQPQPQPQQQQQRPQGLYPTGDGDGDGDGDGNGDGGLSAVDSICLGSGRFLRSVLVPALVDAGLRPAIVQTRGRTLLEHFLSSRDGNGGGCAALRYEVDTVEYDGSVRTELVACHGVGTMGSAGGRFEVAALLRRIGAISVIGIGVTEAGLASSRSQAMVDLTFVLRELHGLMVAGSHGAATAATATAGAGGSLVCPNPNGRICVVNTDNVPNNGRVIRGHVLDVARRERGAASSSSAAAAADSDTGAVNDNEDDAFITFLKTRVAFLDTMVDRITSQRDGSDGLVPRCEPVPSKALVVQDIHGDLPPALLHESIRKRRGVVVRTKPGQLDADVALKLRIANGTHTAAAQCMALCGMSKTDALSSSSSSSSDGSAGAGAEGRDGGLVMEYLDSLFETQVLPGAVSDDSIRCDEGDVRAAWDDWRRRLSHPHFGLSTFFITQNCAAKGGIRLGPTIRSLLFRRGAGGQTGEGGGVSVSVSMAFALASILRFVTPTTKNGQDSDGDGDCLMMESSGSVGAATSKIYRGWLDGGLDRRKGNDDSGGVGEHDDVSAAVEYADGLRYNLDDGWYEFRCDCYVQAPNSIAASYEGGMRIALPVLLGRLSAPSAQQRQPISYRPAVEAYLKSKEGGDLADVASRQNKDADCGFEDLVDAVSTLYARMVAGDGILDLLLEMRSKSGVYHDGFSTGCSVLHDRGVVA